MSRFNPRTELLTIRMTMQEKGEIGRVAEAHRITVAELVRRFVRRELAALDLDRKARPEPAP